MADQNAPTPVPANSGDNYHKTLPEFLRDTSTLLTNALLPDVWAKLQNRGYTQADIQKKMDELGALQALDEAQSREYGEQYKATDAYAHTQATLNDDYIDHLGYARIALKHDVAAQTALGLRGRRKASQSGYAAQGLLFYTNALGNAAWTATLDAKGVSANELRTMQSAFRTLDTLAAAQQKETGEAQEATKARDAAYDTLHDWVHDFRETAKIALRTSPQMREQLGIKEIS